PAGAGGPPAPPPPRRSRPTSRGRPGAPPRRRASEDRRSPSRRRTGGAPGPPPPSRAGGGRGRAGPAGRHLGEEGVRALADLLEGEVLLVRREPPLVAEGVRDLGVAVAPEHVGHRDPHLGPRRHR